MQNQEERIKFLLLCYHKSPELRCSAGATVQQSPVGGWLWLYHFQTRINLLARRCTGQYGCISADWQYIRDLAVGTPQRAKQLLCKSPGSVARKARSWIWILSLRDI